jgi:3-deoxy-D-manno-octulosonic-acid transferase
MLHDATLYLTQSAEDSVRLVALGAPAERVVAVGNLKYDLALPGTSPLASWLADELARSDRGPLLVAGSVIAGEEAAVLEAFAAIGRKWPAAVLVLAPRKPERFDTAAEIIKQAGQRAVRRSALSLDPLMEKSSRGPFASAPGEPHTVLLLDTIGELASLYRLADVVFVGGSLEAGGGHNPLEPAACGKAPVFGPSMDNFREMAARFLRVDAAIEVRSGAELAAAWTALLEDPERRSRMGEAACEIVERSRGATSTTLERISKLLAASQPQPQTLSQVKERH